MADKKATKQKPSVTPRGRAIWPHTHAPDKKFKKEYGEYRVRIAIPEADAQPLVDKIEAGIKAQYAEAKNEFTADPKNKSKKFENSKPAKIADKPYTVGEAEDEGLVIFNFKSPAGGKRSDGTEWSRTIPVYDAQRNPLPAGTRIGGGSTIKVSYTLNPFSTAIGTGMSLRLEGVQVLEMKEFSRTAESFGFEDEDGYSVNENAGNTEADGYAEEETDAPAGDTKGGADF